MVRDIEAQVERETARALPAAEMRERRTTLMLWTVRFAEFAIFYLYQTFVPTILAGEGYAIVKSLAYSVVIYGMAVPAYLLGGRIVEWLDRKYSVLLAFAATILSGPPTRGRRLEDTSHGVLATRALKTTPQSDWVR